jgi:uracil-DNA glycosylase
MTTKKPDIDSSWYNILTQEFEKSYFISLKNFLVKEKAEHIIYPPGSQIFYAFNKTPFDKVKVVVIGQDPYHGEGQAHGLCFSVPKGIAQPPSLKNIFKELNRDNGMEIPKTGNLESWAEQGVLLLNATLTVRAHQAASHQKKGWETFTDKVIEILSEEKEGLVFLLWGAFAQAKSSLIDEKKHYILKSVHPSPLSAHRGFIGCGHFSKTNEMLHFNGMEEIDWEIK